MPQASSNGMVLEYETFGDRAGPPVLLIMGLGAQMTVWPDGFCQQLADQGHYVIRFDNRDIGLSTHLDHLGLPDGVAAFMAVIAGEVVDAPYSLGDMADDAAGLLDALDIAEAHIVGASMGGMIAQRFVTGHPERTSSLTSIFSMPRFILCEEQVVAVLMAPDPGNREGRIEAGVAAARLTSGGGFGFDEELTRKRMIEGIDRSWHPDGQARQILAILADGDRTEGLAGITAPTLVIHGTADPLVVPQGGQETADAIPGAELVWVEGMGHEMPEAAWPQILDPICALIERAEVAAGEARGQGPAVMSTTTSAE
jgi:pimeloyl-ACP methyl ester carboxylesterase